MEVTTLILNCVLLTYLGGSVVYFLFFAWGARKQPKEVYFPTSIPTDHHLVLIPAYKEDEVIVDTVRKALEVDYSGEYDVVVIADGLQGVTLGQLKQLDCQVIRFHDENPTKAKALFYALQQLHQDYSTVTILDADNWMHPDYLTEISHSFWKGYRVVQGCRTAKNEDTQVALWDGFSEAWNNQIFGTGHMGHGLPPRLIGSGMAFSYSLIYSLLKNMDAVGGFDKALELELAARDIAIDYNPKAVVYDEKVSNLNTFQKQRRRWTSAQFHYFRRHAGSAFQAAISDRNWAYLNKTVQMILPPKMSIPTGLGAALLINIALGHMGWSVAHAACLLGLATAVQLTMPQGYSWQKLTQSAGTFFRMAVISTTNLFRLRGANKRFIHTPHQAH